MNVKKTKNSKKIVLKIAMSMTENKNEMKDENKMKDWAVVRG